MGLAVWRKKPAKGAKAQDVGGVGESNVEKKATKGATAQGIGGIGESNGIAAGKKPTPP